MLLSGIAYISVETFLLPCSTAGKRVFISIRRFRPFRFIMAASLESCITPENRQCVVPTTLPVFFQYFLYNPFTPYCTYSPALYSDMNSLSCSHLSIAFSYRDWFFL